MSKFHPEILLVPPAWGIKQGRGGKTRLLALNVNIWKTSKVTIDD